jgi:hypothetical protein
MCGTKVPYYSNNSAAGAIKRMKERGFDVPGFKLRAYRCPYCKAWHVGHTKLRNAND